MKKFISHSELNIDQNRDGSLYYFSTKDCPDIKIFKNIKKQTARGDGTPGNAPNTYVTTRSTGGEEVTFGYGYYHHIDAPESKYACFTNINIYSPGTPGAVKRTLGEKFYEYVVILESDRNELNEKNRNKLNDENKCFLKLIYPKDGVLPTISFEDLSVEKQAELLGTEPASPLAPLGAYRNIPPINLGPAAKPSSHSRSYKRRGGRRRSTRRNRRNRSRKY